MRRYSHNADIRMKTQVFVDEENKLTGSELARHYVVDPATIRRWRRDGMPCHWYSAKMVRYKLSEVEAWLKAKGETRPHVVTPQERRAKETATK
jgi:hypothetical protein